MIQMRTRSHRSQKKNLKMERIGSADSTYQKITAKRKAGSQNSGEEIMKKLEFDNDKSISADDADKGSSKRNVDAMVDLMTHDYMRRKKIHNR